MSGLITVSFLPEMEREQNKFATMMPQGANAGIELLKTVPAKICAEPLFGDTDNRYGVFTFMFFIGCFETTDGSLSSLQLPFKLAEYIMPF